MNTGRDKIVWFKDWASYRLSPDTSYSSEDGIYRTRNRPTLSPFWSNVERRIDDASEKLKGFATSIRRRPTIVHPAAKQIIKKKILDPKDPYLQQWNKAFVICCFLAVSLDPLFFYIPVVDGRRHCLDLDKKLAIIASVLRSLVDIFYVIHIIFQFRTGFIVPSVFGRGDLIEDTSVIGKRYLNSYFIIDILSVLPIPQVVVLLITPALKDSISLVTKESLKHVVFIQYIPRFLRIYPLYKEVTRTSGIFAERAWTGAAFNLILYMLASQALGSLWYLFSIERKDRCWRKACKDHGRNYNELYCHKDKKTMNLFLSDHCFIGKEDDVLSSDAFNFGIFVDALRSGVMETTYFPTKFFYCFWWGLRNLSSLGQNLKPSSTYIGENMFAIFIAILGLLLFSLLIGNIQKYLQSTTVRVEEMRVKRQDAEQWMSHRMLPQTLRQRVRRHEQYKWQETRGVEEDRLVRSLPKDLRRDIKRHLCLALLTRVPMFEKMDNKLLDLMCERLKPVWYTENSFILREGDPVDEMLFIMRGKSVNSTTNGGRTGFFNSLYLKAGDFCGEELLTWALDPNSSPNLPTSTTTVQALTEIEAFSLTAKDLKSIAPQFRRLHSKQLRHTFKFYSLLWRTWAARFIQAAWRRHCKRILEKSFLEEEERLQLALSKETETAPSFGAFVYAAKFAANSLRALRRNGPRDRLPSQKILSLLPSKPVEPDFTSDDRM